MHAVVSGVVNNGTICPDCTNWNRPEGWDLALTSTTAHTCVYTIPNFQICTVEPSNAASMSVSITCNGDDVIIVAATLRELNSPIGPHYYTKVIAGNTTDCTVIGALTPGTDSGTLVCLHAGATLTLTS